jgi:quercetin dioxygenase-like cupin family protein
MRRYLLPIAAAFVVAGSGLVLAQDPVKTEPTHYSVVLDNAAVRILKVSYPAGATGVMHSHPDAVIIGLGASKVRFTMPDKATVESDMANEGAMYTAAGSHRAEVLSKTAVNALVVELKGAGGTAVLPKSREGMIIKMLAEGPKAMAYRSTAAPGFAEPAGTKHDYDQVVIALATSGMSLSIDGKPAKTSWARGDVQFIGRGTPHEAKNTGGTPVDFIIVAIK